MMLVYTYSEARPNFAAFLEKAAQEGEARAKRKDGQVFAIVPKHPATTPSLPRFRGHSASHSRYRKRPLSSLHGRCGLVPSESRA